MDKLVKHLSEILHKPAKEQQSARIGNIKLIIDRNKFHTVPQTKMDKSVLFVDGGSAALFESAGLCWGYIRTAAVLYRNNKRIKRWIRDFHILIFEEEESINIKTYPETPYERMIYSLDKENKSTESITLSILSNIRRIAELDHATSINNDDIDYICLDGTLDSRYTEEKNSVNSLLSSNKICSVSKSCNFITDKGIPITQLLGFREGKWVYILHNSKGTENVCFARLHEKSDYVFRLDIQNSVDPIAIASVLSMNSIDPIFLGYPYGLIDVDMQARISEEEKKKLQTKISLLMGKDWNEFSIRLHSMDAHDILDKIRY